MKKRINIIATAIFIASLLLTGCKSTMDVLLDKGLHAVMPYISGMTSSDNTVYQNFRLSWGIYIDNIELIQETIVSGASIDNIDHGVSFDDAVEKVFPQQPALQCALSFANADEKTIQVLIDNGADVNFIDVYGNSYLIDCAKRHGSIPRSYIPLLLENGADPNVVCKEGYTALDYVLMSNEDLSDSDMIDVFLKNGTKVSKQTIGIAYNRGFQYVNLLDFQEMVKRAKEDGETGLSKIEEAAILGDKEKLEKEIWWGIPDNETELVRIFAAAFGSPEILEKIANKLGSEFYLSGLIQTAVKYGNLENVQFLVEHGENVNQEYKKNGHGGAKFTLFQDAVRYDHYDIAKYLLENGATRQDGELLARVEYTEDNLTWAAINGNFDMVKLLLEAGAPTDLRHMFHAMVGAIYKDHLDMLAFLVEKNNGVVNTDNILTDSPLTWASMYCNINAMEYLIQKGADVDGYQKDGAPLMGACIYGGIEAVRVLLKNGADTIYMSNEKPVRHVSIAVYHGDFEMLEAFIEYGADVQNELGTKNLVLTAAENGSVNILQCLIDNGAPIDGLYTGKTDPLSLDYTGDTALHIAVRFGARECAEVLLAAGADAAIQNSEGKTAYDIAVQDKNEPMARIFKDAGVAYEGSSNDKPGKLDNVIDGIKEKIGSAADEFAESRKSND